MNNMNILCFRPSSVRRAPHGPQRHPPVSGLAVLLQRFSELPVGDRGPARSRGEDPLRQVSECFVWEPVESRTNTYSLSHLVRLPGGVSAGERSYPPLPPPAHRSGRTLKSSIWRNRRKPVWIWLITVIVNSTQRSKTKLCALRRMPMVYGWSRYPPTLRGFLHCDPWRQKWGKALLEDKERLLVSHFLLKISVLIDWLRGSDNATYSFHGRSLAF